MRTIAVVLGLVLFTVVAGIALTRSTYGFYRGWHGEGRLGFVGKRLDLTDSQKQQIKSIWHAESPSVAALIREFASEQKQMNTVSSEAAFDPTKIVPIANAQAATLAKILVEKEKLVSMIYTNVLTPEQRAKADQWRQQWPTQLDQIADHIATVSGDSSEHTQP